MQCRKNGGQHPSPFFFGRPLTLRRQLPKLAAQSNLRKRNHALLPEHEIRCLSWPPRKLQRLLLPVARTVSNLRP
jgi:hypothetical protein